MAPPLREGLRPAVLAQLDAHIRAELPHVRSLLIARHDRLVFERYYADAFADGLHNIQPMTKSLSSALVGLALRKGLVASLADRALDYLPAYREVAADPGMREITVRHFLTMASGIDEMPLSFDQGRVFGDN